MEFQKTLKLKSIITIFAFIFLLFTKVVSAQNVLRPITSCMQLDSMLVVYDSLLTKDKSALYDLLTGLDSIVNCDNENKVFTYNRKRFNVLSQGYDQKKRKVKLKALIDNADRIDNLEYSSKLRVNLISLLKNDDDQDEIEEIVSYLREQGPTTLDTQCLAYGLFNYANFITKRRRFVESVPIYQEAIELSKLGNITNIKSMCYMQLAFIHRQIEDLEGAIRYGRKALDLATDKIVDQNIFFYNTNLAHWYSDIGNVDSSYYFLNKAKGIYPDDFRILFREAALHNLKGQSDSVLVSLEKLKPSFFDNKIELDNYFGFVGMAYEQMSNHKLAKQYYKKAIDSSELYSFKDYENRVEYLSGFLRSYFYTKDTSLVQAVRVLKECNDSLRLLDLTNQVTQSDIKYSSLLKQKENLALKQTNLLNQSKIRTQRILLVSALAVVFVFFFFSQSLQRKNKDILRLNGMLNLSNKKLQLQNREMRHRSHGYLKTAINMLTEQRRNSSTTELDKALLKTEKRIRALSSVSAALDRKKVDSDKIDKLITELIEDLTYKSDKPIAKNISIADAQLDNHQIISLALITNELVFNSLKYAFKNTSVPEISLSIESVNDKIHYNYNDNGSGMDGTIKGTGEGRQLIADFVTQVHGKATESNENGYSFNFVFDKALNYA